MEPTEQLTLKDITNDWVREHYNIGKERNVKRAQTPNRDLISFLEGTSGSLDQLLDKIENLVGEILQNGGLTRAVNYTVHYQVTNEYDWDVGEYIDKLVIWVEYTRYETDNEVISRLKSKKRQLISRRNAKAKKAKAEQEKVLNEKQLLKDLMEKYPEEVGL